MSGAVKRALVTGAGRRLGRAMALELARRGHDVAVHYATSHAQAQEVAGAIRAMGRRATTLKADLTDEKAMQTLVARAAEGLGGALNCLVNNASIFEHDRLETATFESWSRHFTTNLRAPFVLMQHFARQAPLAELDAAGEKRARALVVNMLDQRVLKLTPEFMTYSLAKQGLWALTRTGAQALAPDVRVNAIAPGTTLPAARQSDSHFRRQRAAVLLERGANLEDITAALGYLLDAPAVTGQVICVDGGQHLGWQTPDILGVD